MGAFFLTWLSYFIILLVVCYVLLSLQHKSASPTLFVYANLWFGGLPIIAVIVLSLAFAAVSKFDPLFWVWDGIAQVIEEDRKIL